MSYENPKVYFSDPTAFQKGFEGSFNQYIQLQREQLAKQKEQDRLKEEEATEFNKGIYDTDLYKNASKSVRDALENYFSDIQPKYMAASKSERPKILAEALAEANEFVNSYRITNESKGNLLATDYENTELSGFFSTKGPGIATYKEGQLGITYGDQSFFIPKKSMLNSKPITAKEYEDSAEEAVLKSIELFDKNSGVGDIEIVNRNKNYSINRLIEGFSQEQKIAYMLRNSIEPEENETNEVAIAKDLESRFEMTKSYTSALALQNQPTKQELEIQKEQRAEARAIRKEQRQAKAEPVSYFVDYTKNNPITEDKWNNIIFMDEDRSLENMEDLASEYGFTVKTTKKDISETGEIGFVLKDNFSGASVTVYKRDTPQQVYDKIARIRGTFDPYSQFIAPPTQ